MKFLKSISLFCFIAILLLLGILVFMPSMFYDLASSRNDVNEKSTDVSDNTDVPDLAVTTKKNVTTCDTVYEVESYVGNTYVHSIEALPFSFSGLNREELIKEIERYELSPTFADKQNGFESIELVSFHPDKITVKKIYKEETEKIIYYIKAVNHDLVVFRSDQDEPYMPTDLTLDMLPENVQQEIINIKCFNDIREIYDFLESYTS